MKYDVVMSNEVIMFGETTNIETVYIAPKEHKIPMIYEVRKSDNDDIWKKLLGFVGEIRSINIDEIERSLFKIELSDDKNTIILTEVFD